MITEQQARAMTLPELVNRLTIESSDPVLLVLLGKLEGVELEFDPDAYDEEADRADTAENELRQLRNAIDDVIMQATAPTQFESVTDVRDALRDVRNW